MDNQWKGNIFQKREEKLEILEKKIKIFLIIMEDFLNRKRKILYPFTLQDSKTMERKYISKKGRKVGNIRKEKKYS